MHKTNNYTSEMNTNNAHHVCAVLCSLTFDLSSNVGNLWNRKWTANYIRTALFTLDAVMVNHAALLYKKAKLYKYALSFI